MAVAGATIMPRAQDQLPQLLQRAGKTIASMTWRAWSETT
jgi:hypothetical protein